MQDAVTIWIIVAKEGYPTAQRELALEYLAHLDLEERVINPRRKQKEVFKAQFIETYQDQNGIENEKAKSEVVQKGCAQCCQ